jgi:hypothetical protein
VTTLPLFALFLNASSIYLSYRPTVLCKIVGVYQIGYHNRETGKRTMEQVAVMQVSMFVVPKCCSLSLLLLTDIRLLEYLLRQKDQQDL